MAPGRLNNAPVISKGYYQSIEDLKTKKNFIVVPDIESYKTGKGIFDLQYQRFLAKPPAEAKITSLKIESFTLDFQGSFIPIK